MSESYYYKVLQPSCNMRISRLFTKFYILFMFFRGRCSNKTIPYKLKIITLIKALVIITVVLIVIRVMNGEAGETYLDSEINNINITPTEGHDPIVIDRKKWVLKFANLNLNTRIRNWKRFQLLKDNSVMIVVQVHKDVVGLEYLIRSLLNVRYIETALLVFSHSYYDDIINSRIRSIKKCGVLQVYYPFSVQVYNDIYPGQDKDECVGDKNEECSTRNAVKAERKHHWWWTANYIFEKYDVTSYFKGYVIFLEENHYVSPDLIHMLAYMRRTLHFYPTVDLLAFGRPDSGVLSNYDILNLEAWRPPYTFGLSFNRTFWRRITAHAMHFCTFNDYDWSYSLYYAMQHFQRGYAEMVLCAAQRVFSTKVAGKSQDHFDTTWSVQRRLNRSYTYLFPSKVKLVQLWGINGAATPATLSPDAVRGRGGWGDIRDQMLCYDIMASQMTTTETDQETVTSTNTSSLHVNV